jgi:hypothetical protein
MSNGETHGPETPTMDAATQAAWDAWVDSRIARMFDGEVGAAIAEFASDYVSGRLAEVRKAVEDDVADLRSQLGDLRDAVAALEARLDALADDNVVSLSARKSDEAA